MRRRCFIQTAIASGAALSLGGISALATPECAISLVFPHPDTGERLRSYHKVDTVELDVLKLHPALIPNRFMYQYHLYSDRYFLNLSISNETPLDEWQLQSFGRGIRKEKGRSLACPVRLDLGCCFPLPLTDGDERIIHCIDNDFALFNPEYKDVISLHLILESSWGRPWSNTISKEKYEEILRFFTT